MRTPWIAITADYDWKGEKYNIAAAYIRAVERAGGQAAVLLPGENRKVQLPEWADGLLLTGGSDLDPMYFGEAVRRGNRDINPRRDAWELSLARRCTEEQRPILGICRGIQVMAVAAGGTIVQDIYEGEAATRLQHEQRAPGGYPTHEVFLAQDSRPGCLDRKVPPAGQFLPSSKRGCRGGFSDHRPVAGRIAGGHRKGRPALLAGGAVASGAHDGGCGFAKTI